jgi:hypothetical protein
MEIIKAKMKPKNLKDVINIEIKYEPINFNYNNVGTYDIKK